MRPCLTCRTRESLAIITGMMGTSLDAPSNLATQFTAQDDPEDDNPLIKNAFLSISSRDCMHPP